MLTRFYEYLSPKLSNLGWVFAQPKMKYERIAWFFQTISLSSNHLFLSSWGVLAHHFFFILSRIFSIPCALFLALELILYWMAKMESRLLGLEFA